MQDASIYSKDSVWTEEETACSERILSVIQRRPEVTVTSFSTVHAELFPAIASTPNEPLVQRIWTRLHTEYPHMFAVALAKGNLESLNLDGTSISEHPEIKPVTQLSYKGWAVTVDDLQAFTIDNDLRPPIFELCTRLFLSPTRHYKPVSYTHLTLPTIYSV